MADAPELTSSAFSSPVNSPGSTQSLTLASQSPQSARATTTYSHNEKGRPEDEPTPTYQSPAPTYQTIEISPVQQPTPIEPDRSQHKIVVPSQPEPHSELEPAPVPYQPTPQPDQQATRDAANMDASQRTAESEWITGFCNCCSPPNLGCEAFTCPCILAGRVYSRLREPDVTHRTSTNVYCWSCCGLSFLLLAGLPLCWCMLNSTRKEIRYKYNIKDSSCNDCWKPFFFPCCTLIQEEKEIIAREKLRREDEQEKQKQLQSRSENMVYQASPN